MNDKLSATEPAALCDCLVKAEIRKRAEAKARRMLLKAPKRQMKR